MIDLTNVNKAEVLAALYNGSHPQGMGFMQFTTEDMTVKEAENLLKEYTYFDYLKGRVMKIDLSKDQLDQYLYDRDNGEGAAERILKEKNII